MASCNSSSYGYSMAGDDGAKTHAVERLTFPFDTGTASIVGNLSRSKHEMAGHNCSTYGYVMGGIHTTLSSQIERIAFPFDSGTAIIVGLLGSAVYKNGYIDGTDFVTLFI